MSAAVKISYGTHAGFEYHLHEPMGHLMVTHDGTITWDDLQAIKNLVWGIEARAIEVYPAEADKVDGAMMRHLWRLGEHDFCPDLLGNDYGQDSLEVRHAQAWSEARG